MDPSSLTLPTAFNAVRMIVKTFEGYGKGKFIKSDKAVREEIRRRVGMLRNHVERIHAFAHKSSFRELRSSCDDVLISIQGLSDDAQFSVTTAPASSHPDVGNLSKKVQKKLLEHDLKTLNLLVEVTRDTNDLLKAMREEGKENELESKTGSINDRIGRAQNHFNERNMFIDGMM